MMPRTIGVGTQQGVFAQEEPAIKCCHLLCRQIAIISCLGASMMGRLVSKELLPVISSTQGVVSSPKNNNFAPHCLRTRASSSMVL